MKILISIDFTLKNMKALKQFLIKYRGNGYDKAKERYHNIFYFSFFFFQILPIIYTDKL